MPNLVADQNEWTANASVQSSKPRLVGALVISIAFHAAIIVPWSWSVPQTPLAGQILLQASLNLAPHAEPREARKERRGDDAQRRPGGKTQPGATTVNAGSWSLAAEERPSSPGHSTEDQPEMEARVLEQPTPPEYPEDALARKLESCVLASVSVASDGSVTGVEIIAADIPGVFDAAVIASQMNAKYLPARAGGSAVASKALAVAGFVLSPDRRLNCALKYAETARRLLGQPSTQNTD